MKSTMTKLMLVIAIGSVVLGSALAGTLDPPGPPAPTMVTLQQIYDKGGLLSKTGQTGCWNAAGTSISCAGTGQDGAYQAGVSVVGPRFTNNNDGTVKDNLTKLIWLRNANCFLQNWTNALSNANTLGAGSCGLTDGSVAGDWRLPNLRELQSLIDYGTLGPALPTSHPFSGVALSEYWSSTTVANFPGYAWHVNVDRGYVNVDIKSGARYVWPVRGGQ